MCTAAANHMCCMQVIRTDPASKAPTLLFRVSVDRGISWEDSGQRLLQVQGAATQAGPPEDAGTAPDEIDEDISIVGGKPACAPLLCCAEFCAGVQPCLLTRTAALALSASCGLPACSNFVFCRLQ